MASQRTQTLRYHEQTRGASVDQVFDGQWKNILLFDSRQAGLCYLVPTENAVSTFESRQVSKRRGDSRS